MICRLEMRLTIFSSLFVYKNSFKSVLTYQKKSLLLVLILLCGDVETHPGPSSLSRDQFQTFLSGKGIKIVHQNIRGLLCNFDMLQELIISHPKIDIITLSETHLTKSNLDARCELDGYTFVRRDRDQGKGGGVALYVKNGIIFKRRSNLEKSLTGSLLIEITIKNSKSFLVGCFYRPPETSNYFSKNYNASIQSLLNVVSNENKETILLGDFNVNYRNCHENTEFKSTFAQNSYKQMIKKPTRTTETSSTLIDLIFTNRPSTLSKVDVIATSLSDHDMVACARKLNSQKYQPRTIKCRNYVNYEPNNLNEDISKIDWQPVYHSTNVSTALEYFNRSVKSVFDEHAPIIEKRVKGKSCPWLSRDVKKLLNDRDKLLRKARRTKNENDWASYKRLRNLCTNRVKRAKSHYYRSLLNENTANPRKFWSTIKTIFPTQVTKSLIQDTDNDKTKKFSDYFKNAILTLKQKSMPLMNFTWRFTNPAPNRTNQNFTIGYISKIFVEKELRALSRNKATGPDELPPGMLKDCATHISKPLSYILNLSIDSGTVPSIWKAAKITPIFKSGNRELPENYRPISVLPVLSKILEKAVHHRLLDFLESNSLLSESQYGFRKHRSTKLAATLLCDDIRREMNNGNLIGVAYLDLSKAFDTIGHSLLINKLSAYGVKGKELQWFSSYLFNRTQVVSVGKTNSDTESIYCGVPQGSILGPLLFILFFNDLADSLTSKVIKYADDTVIYCASKDVDIIESKLNSEIENVGLYCRENELLLNLKKGKTEVMLFGTSRRLCQCGRELRISYNNELVSFVKKYVYLGNLLDNTLTLSNNFDRAYKRASSRLRLLKNVRNHLNIHAATKIFDMMILPILTYAGPVKPVLTKTQTDQLASLHRRAKTITGNNNLKCPTNEIQQQICLLVKKCLVKQTNSSIFDNYFKMLSHQQSTRNNNISIELPRVKLESAKQSFYFAGAKIYNNLPTVIRSTVNISKFRSLISNLF